MPAFDITSTAGVCYGIWAGDTEAEALLSLHRDGGYDSEVWLEDGELQFKNEACRRRIGDTSDWVIERV